MSFKGNILFYVPIVFGIYYFFTGIWPVVHMESFVWVTGPKQDYWLVRTVGLVLASVGLSVFTAGVRKNITLEIIILAMTCAISLTFIDIYYVFSGVIRPVYLLDAVLEVVLLIFWCIILYKKFN